MIKSEYTPLVRSHYQPLLSYLSLSSSINLHQFLCLRASVPASLPVYLFTCQPIHFLPSSRLSPSVFIYLSSLSQSVDLFLCPTHLSSYLSLFPIRLFHHLSPPNSSEQAVCREKCSARVNGSAAAVAVNTSECFCSALCFLLPPCKCAPYVNTLTFNELVCSWNNLT